MQNIIKYFKSQTLFLIFLAFLFGVVCRYEWIYWASQYPEFFWNNTLMISTNDGYAFAEGARDMIAGFHQPNDLSFYGSSLSTLTFLVYKILPFDIETIMLYLSMFMSSLIVVPMILLAREIGELRVGFIAALLSVIAHSYYNRTMAGYYDTDMLTIVFPVFILWGIVRLNIKKDKISYLIISFSMLIYHWWYPSSSSLNMGIIGFFILYSLIFERTKNNFLAVLFMLIAVLKIFIAYKVALILGLYLIIYFMDLKKRDLIIISCIILGLFAYFGGLHVVIFNLKFYIFRDVSDSGEVIFKFFNVNQTIRESGSIDLDLFVERISGNIITFAISFIGYIFLCFKNKAFILTLPMVALGLLASSAGIYCLGILLALFVMLIFYHVTIIFNIKRNVIISFYSFFVVFCALLFYVLSDQIQQKGAGLRFTIYAIPVLSFSFAYFLNYIYSLIILKSKYKLIATRVIYIISFLPFFYVFNTSKWIQEIATFKEEFYFVFTIFIIVFILYYFKYRKSLVFASLFTSTVFALMPFLTHIQGYKPLTVFANSEVNVLNQLKQIADTEDYTLAWWDYGYPIRYYSDTKTLIDGGKHLGRDNFSVSFALSTPQTFSANMARLETEYTERNFHEHFGANLEQMLKDYNYTDVNDFLIDLGNKDFKTPQKTRDIYYYLPDRMIHILPTVLMFSNLDLNTGKLINDFELVTFENTRINPNGDVILRSSNTDESHNIVLTNDKRKVAILGQDFELAYYIQTEYNNKKLLVDKKNFNPYSNYVVIYMKDYGRYLLMDKQLLESAYIKLFVLEEYDEDLFEPVILEPSAKVYKVKK